MRILFIHNDYYRPSGEEHAADALVSLLQGNGHEVLWYRRSSVELGKILFGKIRAPFLSIYNYISIRNVRNMIRAEKPDVVQIQNLYPLISQGVLKAIKKEGVPLVMRCPNYRLFCPTGLFYDSAGNVCERCTGHGHELWCIRKNCMQNIGKSAGYAFRNYVARKTDIFRKYVDLFIVQSEFQKRKFTDLGIPEERLEILPGITPNADIQVTEFKSDNLVTFVGRVSREKGIDDFLEAANRMPHVRFAIAGSIPKGKGYSSFSPNIEWRGFLKDQDLDDLYKQSAVIIVPSKWYEGFPNVITRAMSFSKPVITTNLGCLPEIVDDGINGYTYIPGNIGELVSAIQRVISDPEGAKQMGKNGRDKALREFSQPGIYNKLAEIYLTVVNQ